MRARRVAGRVWVLTDGEGRLYDDIDTDQIFHNRHLHITEVTQMGQYALGNLKGWEDFPTKAGPSDVVLAGKNFGAGSSRQQAVDCFRALRVSAIVAESFGAIYKRNAINSGFPIIEVPGLSDLVGSISTGDELLIDLVSGEIVVNAREILQAAPFSPVQMDIYQAGDLFAYGRLLDIQDGVTERATQASGE